MDNIRIIFGRIFAVILLVALSLFVFFASPEGLQFAGRLAEKYIPGQLYYQRISGQLLKQIHIEGFYYHYKNTYIRVHHLDLYWSPFYLFRRELRLMYLKADHVEVIAPPSGQNSEAFSYENPLLYLKWGLTVNKVELHQIFYGENESHYLFQLADMQGKLELNLDQWNTNLTFQLRQPFKMAETLKLNGAPENFTFLSQTHFRNFGWLAQGIGSKTSLLLQLSPENKNDQIGAVHGGLSIDWIQQLHWNMWMRAHNLDLSDFEKKLPYRADFSFTAEGLDSVWKFYLKNIRGVLSSTTITGFAQGHYESDTHFGGAAHLMSPEGQVVFSVERAEQLQARWDIAIQQLNAWYLDLGGALDTKGTLTFDQKNGLETQGALKGKNLILIDTTMDAVHADWLVDSKDHMASHVILGGSNINFHGHFLKTITLSMQGWFRQHRIHVTVQDPETRLETDTNGSYMSQQGWNGRVDRLVITHPAKVLWQIQKPMQLIFTKQAIEVSPDCLSSSYGKICTAAHWEDEQPWFAYLDVPYFNVAVLSSWLPDIYSLSGNINAHIRLDGEKNDLTKAVVQSKLSNVALSVAGYLRKLTLPEMSLSIQDANQSVTGDLKANLQEQGSLHTHMTLPSFDWAKFNFYGQSVKGSFSMDVPNLSPYAALVSAVNAVQGKLSASLRFDGSLAHPNIDGRVQIQNGQFGIPEYGVVAKNVEAMLESKARAFHYDISMMSGNTLNITGTGNAALDYFQTNATISGKDIVAINTPQFHVTATPNLQFAMNGTELTLNGSIVVPTAQLHITDYRTVASLPTTDIVYTNLGNANTLWPFYSQLNVTLGDHVDLDAYGLKGNVTGNVQIIQEPQKSTIGNGILKLNNGTFLIYGQTLDIQTGQLNFSQSPLDDPNVNLIAIRVVGQTGSAELSSGNFIVGVKITGTANNPKAELFSEPVELSQTDILSYLLFGHANPNADQTSAALQALSLLNLRQGGGGNPLAEAEKAFGIDQIGVQTNTTVDAMGNTIDEQTSFVVGKYIGQNLYLSYNQGLSDTLSASAPVSLVQLQYYLTQRWSIRTEAGTGYYGAPTQGIDLLYSVNSKK